MDKVSININALGLMQYLSPEYWLSNSSAENLSEGVPLSKIVRVGKSGLTSIPQNALVLDTGNADRGLFNIPDLVESKRPTRTSHKKIVPEGSVLISRLRPYLRQAVYVPLGLHKILGVQEILCSTEFYVLTSTDQKESIAFLVPWLLSSNVQKVFEQAATGGHHPRFSDDLLMKLCITYEIYDARIEMSKRVSELVLGHIEAQIEMRNFF